MHKNYIIFRDLKPDNIVIDKERHALLTDFGLSRETVDGQEIAKSFCGSIVYLAPEMLNRCGHGKAVDWYLLRVLFYELLVRVPPKMLKTTLNFFGEEVIIDTPKDIVSLRGKISEKYLLSPSDAPEIIIYYIKDGKKTFIINGNDYSQYKDSKISTLFLDVNQNSRLYIDSATQLDKEKEKKEKELAELNHKYKQISDKKKDIENDFNIQLRELNAKIMELNKKKCEIIKKKDKELIKLIQEEEQFEEKIYYKKIYPFLLQSQYQKKKCQKNY